jgi:lysophospholipase L1-like esterase
MERPPLFAATLNDADQFIQLHSREPKALRPAVCDVDSHPFLDLAKSLQPMTSAPSLRLIHHSSRGGIGAVICRLLRSVALVFFAWSSVLAADAVKPNLFLIGDSTVKNGTRGQVGWGTPIGRMFDPEKINVQNRALGGRSTRSYLREGLWQKVLSELKAGDFVIIQFGHNDNGAIDSGKARASLKGNGDEAQEVTVKETGQKETVRSFGWNLRKYIADAKANRATPIVCSLVARNIWEDSKVVRSADTFAKWAREAAAQGGCQFIDLNEITSQRYEELGREKVQALFTSADHTHTSPAGAELNARLVVEAIRRLENCPLSTHLRPATSAASAQPGSNSPGQ